MHAYLITGTNEVSVKTEVDNLVKKIQGNPLEFTIDKIDKTRELTDFLKLSQSPGTIIIIKNVDKATDEALNAFLKNLEEPNKNVTFILTASSDYKVLPTILSRCQVIKTKNGKPETENGEIIKFIDMTTGERLTALDKIKKREEATGFLENLTYYLHYRISSENADFKKLAYFLKITQETLDAVNSNGNVSLQLTNFIVRLTNVSGLTSSNKV